jgi:hypothetical protein
MDLIDGLRAGLWNIGFQLNCDAVIAEEDFHVFIMKFNPSLNILNVSYLCDRIQLYKNQLYED